MPRPPLSDDAVFAFRQRIVEVATRLFAQRGFEGVTMRAVAEELSLSAMALYRYVADKQELLVLVRTHAFRRFADAQERAYASADRPLERIRALEQAYVVFALAEPDAYRIMFELRQNGGDHPELLREVERSFSYLRKAVEAAVKAKIVPGDALSNAHVAWATVHGAVSLHLAGKLTLGRDLLSLMDYLVQVFEVSSKSTPKSKRKKR
jgi:AcrR family transcriptional regulator